MYWSQKSCQLKPLKSQKGIYRVSPVYVLIPQSGQIGNAIAIVDCCCVYLGQFLDKVRMHWQTHWPSADCAGNVLIVGVESPGGCFTQSAPTSAAAGSTRQPPPGLAGWDAN